MTEEKKNDVWAGTVIGKTECGHILYYAGLTDKQVWWDVNPFYSYVGIEDSHFNFLKSINGKRINLMFDITNDTYTLPVNIVEMECSG